MATLGQAIAQLIAQIEPQAQSYPSAHEELEHLRAMQRAWQSFKEGKKSA